MEMQANIDTVVHYLFQQEGLRSVPVETLREFVAAHPYSAAGRYLLTRKLKDEIPEEYETEIETSVLYYNNPLWLQFLLEEGHPRPVNGHAEGGGPLSDTAAGAVQVPAPGEIADDVDQEIRATEEEVVTMPETSAAGLAGEEIVQAEATVPPVPEAEDSGTQKKEKVPEPAIEKKTGPSADLLFQPYHTIDYFASQGIKLRAEDLDKDQFGKQLRSFTEWLRSMKRIGPRNPLSEPDQSESEDIQVLAGHSIEGQEVETEAMAEVWIKQGDKARAIAIFEKLSLQNPSKSHYFAGRIEQLKD